MDIKIIFSLTSPKYTGSNHFAMWDHLFEDVTEAQLPVWRVSLSPSPLIVIIIFILRTWTLSLFFSDLNIQSDKHETWNANKINVRVGLHVYRCTRDRPCVDMLCAWKRVPILHQPAFSRASDTHVRHSKAFLCRAIVTRKLKQF